MRAKAIRSIVQHFRLAVKAPAVVNLVDFWLMLSTYALQTVPLFGNRLNVHGGERTVKLEQTQNAQSLNC